MPELMGTTRVLMINDEVRHCYREKPDAEADALRGDEKKEAEEINEAARMWITGLEAVKRKLGIARVIGLSATPFFLAGSGYVEGTLLPWTMSDFSPIPVAISKHRGASMLHCGLQQHVHIQAGLRLHFRFPAR